MLKRNFWISGLLCAVSALYAQELVLPFTATELTPEQKSSNPDYVAYPKPLKAEMPEMLCVTPAEGLGPFSVSATTKVMFSPGNLQFCAGKGTHQCADGIYKQGIWRFAEHQWDYVGDATNGTVYEDGVKCNNALISSTYTGWIDLFGWGTSGWNSGARAYQPWATSTEYTDYYPGGGNGWYNNLTDDYANADWGVYNQIGSDNPGTWRTLKPTEWLYLYSARKNCKKLRGYATINGIPGFVLLPDNWVLPIGLSFIADTNGSVSYSDDIVNKYSLSEWFKMERAGAVFFPLTGSRYENTIRSGFGYYWTSRRFNATNGSDREYAYCTRMSTSGMYYIAYYNEYISRFIGLGVRLVRDLEIL